MNWDRTKTYGGKLHENIAQGRHLYLDFETPFVEFDEVQTGHTVKMDFAEIERRVFAFQTAYPSVATWMFRTGRWAERARDIAAFEKWQQEPDEDYNFAAIKVALLLSR